ncbi:MAG: VCBS repeat-containing protein [Candidatus Midichloria sp.]|nr:VCBS repeat-containing protein [Candidatus Midichloria sp.]
MISIFNGKIDLANTTPFSAKISILLGKGDGTFWPAVFYNVGSYPYGIVAADFNNDGKIDIANANEYSDTISVLLGNGDGTFKSAVFYGVGSYPFGMTTVDINGDDELDLTSV